MIRCATKSHSPFHFPLSKRVFILGPSHHVYLSGCALSAVQVYETPLYNLDIDQEGRRAHAHTHTHTHTHTHIHTHTHSTLQVKKKLELQCFLAASWPAEHCACQCVNAVVMYGMTPSAVMCVTIFSMMSWMCFFSCWV